MRARNMQAMTDDVKAEYPGVTVYGKGDEEHALRTSDHNEDDTPGVRAEQSDGDNIPEHRAIDIMLGAAFTKGQADALVARLLADPAALARLKYIIWNGYIWSRSNGWERAAYTGADRHTDHVHVSGLAADDENAASWPAVRGESMGNYCARGDKSENVKRLQLALNRLIATDGYGLKPLAVDGDYGAATVTAVRTVLGGDGQTYLAELDIRMDMKLAVLAVKQAGLAGAPGPAGPAGPPGPQGEKGDPGDNAVLTVGTMLTVTGDPA